MKSSFRLFMIISIGKVSTRSGEGICRPHQAAIYVSPIEKSKEHCAWNLSLEKDIRISCCVEVLELTIE